MESFSDFLQRLALEHAQKYPEKYAQNLSKISTTSPSRTKILSTNSR